MKLKLIVLLCAISILVDSNAQKRKKNDNIPAATEASKRWEGFKKRQNLINDSWVKNVPFKNVGPTIMSGRVVDLEVNPEDPTHFYVAYASGGLWETTNEGASFTPLFDNEIVMTIGDIAVDWTNEIIYVGTGENNSSRSSYSGYGIFKSSDNGKTWTHLGLEDSHHIGRILIDPSNPNTLWVASLGHLYSKNDERGIYKSTDGGTTWNKLLYVNDESGFVELIMNPNDPNELIAAAWEKDRKAWNFKESGKGSALFKTTNGGDSWIDISSGDNGFPDNEGTGRIGLAYAPSDPSIVYAVLDNQNRREAEEETSDEDKITKDDLRNMTMDAFLNLSNATVNAYLDEYDFPTEVNAVDLKKDISNNVLLPKDLVTYVEDANSMLFDTPVKGAEVYKSTDGGINWQKTHEGYIDALVFSYGYYFGQIRVDGTDPNIIYTMGVPLIISKDGGKTWDITSMENVHADHHALWVNPKRSGHLINGNDGGVNISYDYGETWVKCNSTQVGQFYTVNVDMAEPYNVYGGLQDNGVWKGPSTYEYSYSWYEEGQYPYERLLGGDGMQVAIDTRTNDLVYTGYQFGNYFRINTKTGDRKYITPKHKLGEAPLRWNWQAPIMLSSHNQDIVYFGSNKFHRSMNQGDDFETLSEDLTNGGKKGDVSYGTLTTISESPLQFGVLYVGSDDGLVHVSKDAGQSWEPISATLPPNYWVSRVEASSHQVGRVYVSLNGYRWDNFEALIYQSNDFGKTWKQIGLDLPAEPVNVIKEDPVNENVLYVGTDHGAYVSLDQGQSFMAFNNELPAVPVHDLVIHKRENDLVLGTHGRSIFIADVAAVQQMGNITDAITLFEMESPTHRSGWGNNGSWHWNGFSEPNIVLEVFTQSGGNAQVTIKKDDLLLKSMDASLDKGLNYVEYDLTFDGDQAKDLAKVLELDEEPEARDNGQYYLPAGDYEVTISQGGASTSKTLTIKAPRERPKRKE